MKTKRLLLVLVLSIISFLTYSQSQQDLITGIMQGDKDAVMKAIAAGADVNKEDEGGNTPICSAFFWPEITQLLIDEGADVNSGIYPALISAANNYSTEVVKILLDAGADPNKGNRCANPN